MTLLIAGVVFWTITHLFPAVAPDVRSNLVNKLGEGPYKGLFALDILIALGLIIYGWRTAVPVDLYVPPLSGSQIPLILIAIGIVLFVASVAPSNYKRLVRHPQMTGVVFWSTGHLLLNGDSRSVVLFGGLGIWAILEMVLINKRDGVWVRPESVPLPKSMLTIVVAVALIVILAKFHASFSGVPIFSTALNQ